MRQSNTDRSLYIQETSHGLETGFQFEVSWSEVPSPGTSSYRHGSSITITFIIVIFGDSKILNLWRIRDEESQWKENNVVDNVTGHDVPTESGKV